MILLARRSPPFVHLLTSVQDLRNKFAQETGTFSLAYGSTTTYYGGLEGDFVFADVDDVDR